MLSEIFRTTLDTRNWEQFNWLYPRYKLLRDEFINEYKPTRPIIKNPVKDITTTEE